jgi:methylphosphotriester-DNA--protein-cysteine methyltransferase
MIADSVIARAELKKMIRSGAIKFGGNANLKIYGALDCKSGKRMKRENRVFFSTEQEALTAGYRPCGHCLQEKYIQWIEQVSG